MRDFADRVKRLLLGRPVPGRAPGKALLPKRIALPVFATATLSSVGYVPDEILITLAVAGLAATSLSPWVALAVVSVLVVVVAAYRQTVRAYPTGGGDYEVVSTNLGHRTGLVTASALLSDYVLTVAVSISSGAGYLIAAVPALAPHKVGIGVGIATLLALVNLRGGQRTRGVLALPAYLYMGAIGIMVLVGVIQELTGTLGQASSAAYELAAHPGWDQGLTGLAGALLILRAFSSGCAALTGVDGVAVDVTGLRRPKSKNAATTLLLLGIITAAMLMSVVHLASAVGVRMVGNPATDLLTDSTPVGDGYRQDPVIVQVAATVFADFRPMFYLVTVTTGLILVLAANRAFHGFPALAGVLGREAYLPRQLAERGDGPVRTSGVIVAWAGAAAFMIAFQANTSRLIQLYVVGLFISLTLSQMGMVCHWNRALSTATDPGARRRMRRSRIVNGIGVVSTGAVLATVLLTMLTRGAWITLTIMAALYLVMKAIRRHYRHVNEDLAVADLHDTRLLPVHVHAIVPVSRLHRLALRTLTYALSTHPTYIEAVTADIGDGAAERLLSDWEEAGLQVPLTVLDSPSRDSARAIVSYVRSVRRESPQDLVVVLLPEYLVRHWWEQALHNRTELRVRAALRLTPGVVVASVPWQLGRPGHHGIRGTAPRNITDADDAVRHAADRRPTSAYPHHRPTPTAPPTSQENA